MTQISLELCYTHYREKKMNNGLLLAYLLDGQGGGRRLEWEDVERWKPESGPVWLNFDYTQPATRQWIAEESGLDEIAIANLLAEETRPRTVLTETGVIVILRGVNLTPGDQPEDLVSIRLFIDEHRIISCRKRVMAAEDDITRQLRRGQGPAHPADFIPFFAERVIDNMSDLVEELGNRSDQLEAQIATRKSHELRLELSDIRRTVIRLKRYLTPQRDTLARLASGSQYGLDSAHKTWMWEITDQASRYLEDLDSALERATVSHEELTQRISERMEQRVLILAIVTAIFLPLGFITSLLGINVGGIPGATSEMGFVSILAVLGGVLIVEIILLRLYRWL